MAGMTVLTASDLSVENVARVLTKHVALYRTVVPIYQTMMLRSLRELWDPNHKRMLDVGGGTGVVAEAMKELFELDSVTSVDVEDRFLATLGIETATFDGRSLPFPDGSFDCIVLNNVLHHVPEHIRCDLLRECRRVAGTGPVYIKDHITSSFLDDCRLAFLDLLGNLPFSGMVKAKYLRLEDWQKLAASSGFRIEARRSAEYRSGLFASAFPNRLETTMRWQPSSP
jgi:ubiquinone/menaquinone biosynthesis C-methylase UbiE